MGENSAILKGETTLDFDNEFSGNVYIPLFELTTLHGFLRALETRIADKEILNVTVYEFYVAAIDGWMIQLDTYLDRLREFLNRAESVFPHMFKRNRYKEIVPDTSRINIIGCPPGEYEDTCRRIAIVEAKSDQNDHKARYDRMFPSTESRTAGRPSKEDWQAFRDRVLALHKPISDHRNTVSAHKDPNPRPAHWEDIDKVFDYVHELVNDLSLISRRTCLSFNGIGGFTWTERSADMVANAMLAPKNWCGVTGERQSNNRSQAAAVKIKK